MWKFLSDMPHEMSFAIIIACLISIVVISLRGHLKAMYDKKTIELGPSESGIGTDASHQELLKPPVTEIFSRIKRSCGDCLLIMFGIRERHEAEIHKINTNILRSQMNYFEQKSQEVLLWLTQSFQDEMEVLGADKPVNVRIAQYGNYQEALKNALEAAKNEYRKSCKENGLMELSDSEFSSYVKSKARALIFITKSYLSTYYVQTDDTIVTLKHRFEKLDTNHINEIIFNAYENARDVVKEAKLKEKESKEKFIKEIDSFVEINKT